VDTKEILESSFVDVLEKFAFMFADSTPPSELAFPQEPFLHATIGFNGPRKGTIHVVATSSFCVQLAANVLGIDLKCMTPESGADAFKELLNVVCGEVLVRIAGADVVFNLTIPNIVTKPADEWGQLILDPAICGLLVDDMPLLFKMELAS
jgi:CheY-specific phosphatase CheX